MNPYEHKRIESKKCCEVWLVHDKQFKKGLCACPCHKEQENKCCEKWSGGDICPSCGKPLPQQENKCGHGEYFNGNGTRVDCPVCSIPQQPVATSGYADARTPEEREADSKIQMTATSASALVEEEWKGGGADEVVDRLHPQESKEWEEEFDNQFYWRSCTENGEKRIEVYLQPGMQPSPKIPEHFKSFIRNLISKEREEAYKKGQESSQAKVFAEGEKFGYKTSCNQARADLLNEILGELETNPNLDGSTSPNIQHWIESKQAQLKAKYE